MTIINKLFIPRRGWRKYKPLIDYHRKRYEYVRCKEFDTKYYKAYCSEKDHKKEV